MKKTASVEKLKELEGEFRHSVETHGELTAFHPLACRFDSATFLNRAGNADDSQAARRFKTLACDASFAQTGKRTEDGWKLWLDQLVETGFAEKGPAQKYGPEVVSRSALQRMEANGESTEGFVFDEEHEQYVRSAVDVYCIGGAFHASADCCRELASRAEAGPEKRRPQQRAKPINGQELRRMRDQKGSTQEQFAEECGLSRTRFNGPKPASPSPRKPLTAWFKAWCA